MCQDLLQSIIERDSPFKVCIGHVMFEGFQICRYKIKLEKVTTTDYIYHKNREGVQSKTIQQPAFSGLWETCIRKKKLPVVGERALREFAPLCPNISWIHTLIRKLMVPPFIAQGYRWENGHITTERFMAELEMLKSSALWLKRTWFLEK